MPGSMYSGYSLQVVRITGFQTSSTSPPNHVQIKIGEVIYKTGNIDPEGVPGWNTTFTLSRLEPSTAISIRLKQSGKSLTFGDHTIGGVDITAERLLQDSNKDDPPLIFELDSAGAIYLHFKRMTASDQIDVASIHVASAERSVEQIKTSSNGALSTLSTVGTVICALDNIVEAIDEVAQLQSLLKLSWRAIMVLYKVISHQFKADVELKKLAEKMKQSFTFIKKARRLKNGIEKLKPMIKVLLRTTIGCSRFVQEYASHHFSGRILQIQDSQRIEDYMSRFADLGIELDRAMDSNTTRGVDETSSPELLRTLLERSDLSSRHRCLDGTRKEYLDKIRSRLFSDAEKNVIWLTGAAGSGKSTIAVTISDICDDELCPATNLFFERGKDEYASAIQNIALRLASLRDDIRPYIVDAIENNKNNIGDSLRRQFEKLLLEPLRAAADIIDDPVIIILDALDESGPRGKRDELVHLLKNDFARLPPKIRLLVTSRPEDDIMKELMSASHIYHIKLDHHSEDSQGDVARYISAEVMNATNQQIPDGWTWDDVFRILSDAAGGLFVWASTAIRMIRESAEPVDMLENILGNGRSVGAGIDGLYSTVLEQSGIQWARDDCRDTFARIMGLILFAKEGMSSSGIAAFLGLKETTVDSVLGRLTSVLFLETGKPIRLHHTSFADYLTERSEGKAWSIDECSQKTRMAERCFDVMKNELRFNICDIPTSCVRNDDIPGLEERVRDRIPPHLDYACRFWSVHFCELAEPAGVLNQVETFVYNHLLYWLEVISLKKHFSRIAGGALRDACIRIASIHTDISSFIWDAYRLVMIFESPISQSTPHIYLSAISLWKGESRVADHYSRTHPVVGVNRIGKKIPVTCMKVLEGHDKWVLSVAVSPDGKRIASGSEDGTIRIWDADSGELVTAPLRGRDRSVHLVVFSPDGKRVASASGKTIRVWDVASGQLVSGPFVGHENRVNAVAFSPDGGRIVSSSFDDTIRIWNAVTGELILGPLEGRTELVLSVAFSVDGKHIVSGFRDGTIRTWNADSGLLVSGVFKRHGTWVTSVAFSLDGKRVVYSFSDKTICVWDVDSGQQLLSLEGHSEHVLSVAFSPDGKYIASGSTDKTVCIWDVDNGNLVSGPFKGHLGRITSVVFSPDGKRVVSASYDGTIRIWDADVGKLDSGSFKGHANPVLSAVFHPDGRRIICGSADGGIYIWSIEHGKLASNPIKGHSGVVWSLAVSQDGQRIVSGSEDETIRLWDTETGKPVCDPLRGHTGQVTSVAFSRDGKRIVSGSFDSTIRVWDAVSGQLILGPLLGDSGKVLSVRNRLMNPSKRQAVKVLSVAFSPDGGHVVSGSDDGTVRIWDANTGQLVLGPIEAHKDGVKSVAFSPDGTCVVSGSSDQSIRVWDAHTGNLILGPLLGHTDWVRSVAFSPDGKSIISGSDDKTIRIWDAVTGQLRSEPFEGHAGLIRSVAFSPDGRHFVSVSEDKTVRIWRISNDDDFSELHEAHTSPAERVSSKSDLVSREMSKRGVLSEWRLNKDGWVLGPGGELLTWIPEDLRTTLWTPRTIAILNCQFQTKLDIANSPVGEDWCKGFPKKG